MTIKGSSLPESTLFNEPKLRKGIACVTLLGLPLGGIYVFTEGKPSMIRHSKEKRTGLSKKSHNSPSKKI